MFQLRAQGAPDCLKISTMPGDIKTPPLPSSTEGWFTKATDATNGRQVLLRPAFLKKAVIFLLAVIIVAVFTVFATQHES
jgi:hypothetical protein